MDLCLQQATTNMWRSLFCLFVLSWLTRDGISSDMIQQITYYVWFTYHIILQAGSIIIDMITVSPIVRSMVLRRDLIFPPWLGLLTNEINDISLLQISLLVADCGGSYQSCILSCRHWFFEQNIILVTQYAFCCVVCATAAMVWWPMV